MRLEIRFHHLPRVVGMFMLLTLAVNVSAEIRGAPSVEWMTVRSSVVASGKIISIERTKGPFAVVYDAYLLDVSNVVKGDSRSKIAFIVRQLTIDPVFKVGDEAIVFLRLSDGSDDDFCRGKLVPAYHQYPLSVAHFATPGRYFFDGSGNGLKSGKQILDVANRSKTAQAEYLRKNNVSSVKPYCRELSNGDAYAALHSGSLTFLVIPEFMAVDRVLYPSVDPRISCRGVQ